MRVSRPVLRGPAGVTPVGYSPADLFGMPIDFPMLRSTLHR